MSATVHQFSDAIHRREIQQLEAAVKANNIPRIGTNEVVRNDYFFARTPEEQKFRDVPIEKIAPLRTWLDDIFAGAKVIIGIVILWGFADLVAHAFGN